MKKIEIINKQKIKKLDLKKINKYIVKIFSLLNIPSEKISIVFCDNLFIKKINKEFLKKKYVTDVIAFPLKDDLDPEYLGEIVISVEEAVKKSKFYGNSWEKELILYLVHGILHLLGYNDKSRKEKKRMQEEEERIMEELKIKN
jgi:probable rRNA maturation factor